MTAAERKQQSAEIAAVEAELWREFHRLNNEHFAGRLTLGEIRLSTRKMYGGYYQKAKNLIVLSWPAHIHYGWDETLNTFRHEIAHIVHQDHSAAFWAVARQLGSLRRHAQPSATPTVSSAKYIYECPVCKAQVRRRKRLTRSSCGKCDRSFNPAFQLKLVSSPAREAQRKIVTPSAKVY